MEKRMGIESYIKYQQLTQNSLKQLTLLNKISLLRKLTTKEITIYNLFYWQ